MDTVIVDGHVNHEALLAMFSSETLQLTLDVKSLVSLFDPNAPIRANVNHVGEYGPNNTVFHLGIQVAIRLLKMQRHSLFRWFVRTTGVNLGYEYRMRSKFLNDFIFQLNPTKVQVALHYGADPDTLYIYTPRTVLFGVINADYGTDQLKIRRGARIVKILLSAGARLRTLGGLAGNVHAADAARRVPEAVHRHLLPPLLMASIIDEDEFFYGYGITFLRKLDIPFPLTRQALWTPWQAKDVKKYVDEVNPENHQLVKPYRPSSLYETVWLALVKFRVDAIGGNTEAHRIAFDGMEDVLARVPKR